MTRRSPSPLSRFLSRAFAFWVVLGLLVAPLSPVRAEVPRAGEEAQVRARALLDMLTTREKVGQLFLVTMEGAVLTPGSPVDRLIRDYHIGGVLLSRANDNFNDDPGTLEAAHALTASLQQAEWEQSQTEIMPGVTPAYIPLLLAISQDGDGYPASQLLSGVTDLPNPLTLGATWDTGLAERSGAVLGDELQRLGFNLLLGPNLDVLEDPSLQGGTMAARVFGGDPYWVGEMGRAMIRGIHAGSANRVAVLAKDFPGAGSTDRPADQEVATVRKSLEQLKQIELAPFFAVTQADLPPGDLADGVLVSHIRYQGFQGNIRVTTRPVSIDSTALGQILELPQFAPWRAAGGVLMSDDLGSPALRKFSDPTQRVFDPRQVARNALLAGSDLLYVADFTASGDPDSFTSISKTLDFFTQKYDEDPAFAQRVDASVQRILALKYRLYPEFTLGRVLPLLSGLEMVGSGSQVVLESAQAAASLVNPTAEELSALLPDGPGLADRLVFLMDSREYSQCSTCAVRTDLAPDSLREAVLRLYGPGAGGQVLPSRLSAYSFADLDGMLSGEARDTALENSLREAAWVVVALQQETPDRPAAGAFHRLIAEHPELLRNRKVVVFNFAAPVALDATEIASTTAVYALYSKSQPFIDLAARILFQEVTARGAPPLSIRGTGYDLITATSPDPAQVIPLMLDTPAADAGAPTPEAAGLPVYRLGDSIPLRTGVILDHNRHPVPDGTLVRFVIRSGTDTGTYQQLEATTRAGIARSVYRITSNGFTEIRVVSDPAQTSELLQLDIPEGAGAGITAVAPTAVPSETPVPLATPERAGGSAETQPSPARPRLRDWLLAMLLVSGFSGLAYLVGQRVHSLRWGVRWALCTLLGGLSSYVYLAAGFPGGEAWFQTAGTTGLVLVMVLCMGVGWSAGILWHAVGSQPRN